MGSLARNLSNPLLAVAYGLLLQRRIVLGFGSITERDPFHVDEFPPELVVSEQSPEWRILVLVLERLAVVVREVWGGTAVEVFANWMSQIRYIGLYDWHAAEADGIYGKVFDFSTSPIIHLGAFDERSIEHKDEQTNRQNLDRMAGVLLHELFHVADPLHAGIDLDPLIYTYSSYFRIGQATSLSRFAFKEREMIAWVGEMYTFGYETVDRELWIWRHDKLVEWVDENRERLLVRFRKITILTNRTVIV